MKVAILGECMVEFSQQADGLYKLGYGGDTLNTAIYMSRCGGNADYFTAVGDDAFSKSMVNQWHDEGVGVNHVKVCAAEMPGLYVIENDETGERYFHYWRNHAPARRVLSEFPEVFSELMHYSMLFLSGITLSLYSDQDRAALFTFLDKYRKAGGKVIFDNNYRAASWLSAEFAVSIFNQMMARTDIALISFDDELSLYGEHTTEQCITRWKAKGIDEVVVKNGAQGCLVFSEGRTYEIPLATVVKPIDTTAAGDSFNGAYLAAKLRGEVVDNCVADGQFCASTVIMHKGAIIDEHINIQRGANL